MTPPQAAEPPVFATLYASIYETDPAHHLRCRDFEEFAALLREVWQGEISGKGATAKFIPADLDPGHSEAASGREVRIAGALPPPGAVRPGEIHRGGEAEDGPRSRRGTDNVRSSRLLVLDCDGGGLSVEEFTRAFPRWRMVVANTYSSTPERPRWRAFLPCDVAVNATIYRLFTARLLRSLNARGYWSEQQLRDNPAIKSRRIHGFDMVKLGAASIFDLPSQAATGPSASFFLDLREGRRPIDAAELLRWIDLRDPEEDPRAKELAENAARLAALPEGVQRALWEQAGKEILAELPPEEREAFREYMQECDRR